MDNKDENAINLSFPHRTFLTEVFFFIVELRATPRLCTCGVCISPQQSKKQ
jgi:hypothetical protein